MVEQIMWFYLTIVALAFAAFWSWFDIFHTSQKFIYYGLREGNKLFRDKYGFNDAKKATIIYGCVILAFLALGIFWRWEVSALMLMVLGLKGAWAGLRNSSAMKKARGKPKRLRAEKDDGGDTQFRLLEDLRKIVQDGGDTTYFWQWFHVPIPVNGRIWYNFFSWIYRDGVANETKETALWEIRREIEQLSLRPPEKWFPK